MATLASLTVGLDMDTDGVVAGARRTVTALRSIGATTSGMTRDADGNWRSLDGRVLSSAHAMMTNGQRMRDALGGIGQSMRGVGRIAGRNLVAGLRQAGSAGRSVLGGLTKSLGVMSVGAVAASGALAAVPLAVLGLGVMAAAQTSQVKDAFSSLKDHVTKTMQELAQPLVKPLANAAKQMQGIFDDIAPQLGKMFEAAAPMIKPLVEGIGELVKGLVSGLVPVMENAQPLIEGLSAGFGALGSGLGGFFEGLSSGIGAAGGVFESLFGAIGSILPVLGQLMGQMLAVAGPILSRLLDALGPVIQQLGAALMPVIAALGPILDQLVTAFLELLVALLPLLPPLSQIIVALLPVLPPILLALVPLFAALGAVVQALVPIIEALVPVIEFLATALGVGLAHLITTVLVPAVQAIAALLSGDFAGALDLAGQAVSAACDYILLVFTGLPMLVWAAIKPVATYTWQVMKDAGSRMATAAKQGVVDSVKWVLTLPGKARDALSNIDNILVDAGIALLKGFISGIKSMFGSVKSTLGGLTGNLTSWKGPAPLDRRILTPNGRMVIGGFMAGIDKEIPALKRQLGGLTADLPGMAMDVSPRGVMSAALNQRQALTLDVTGSDEDMKRLIRRIVKNDGRGDVQTAFGRT